MEKETLLLPAFDPVEDGETIALAGRILREGGIAAIPTETVYGLAGNALDPEATKKIYAAKGRPSDNPLIVHIAELAEWSPLVAELPEEALVLAKRYWPGPLTIILPKSPLVPDSTSGGLPTVAVRMPENPVALAVIRAAGVPSNRRTARWGWNPPSSPSASGIWTEKSSPAFCAPAPSPWSSCGKPWGRSWWTGGCWSSWKRGKRPSPPA